MRLSSIVVLTVVGTLSFTAKATVFESFPDSTILTTQYPGLTFSNAIILTAGITLHKLGSLHIQALTSFRVMVMPLIAYTTMGPPLPTPSLVMRLVPESGKSPNAEV